MDTSHIIMTMAQLLMTTSGEASSFVEKWHNKKCIITR
jgi:hypothetical protein